MPEEIGIALVVVVIVGWLLIKILQVFGDAVGEICKGISDSLSAHGKARFLEKRSGLSQYVSVTLPNQIDSAEQALDSLKNRLQAGKSQTRWEVRRPVWVREEFRSHTLPAQDETYQQMNASDVDVILQSTPQRWIEQEATLLSQSCNYPHSAPKMPNITFTPVEPLTLQLDEAQFQYDPAKLSEGKISRYFDVERRSVTMYNERRAALVARLDKMNTEVHEWNEQSRAAKEACVRDTQQLLREELTAYGRVSEQYISQCDGQKRVLLEIRSGYENGIKEDVVNRTFCVLSTLILPRSVPLDMGD